MTQWRDPETDESMNNEPRRSRLRDQIEMNVYDTLSHAARQWPDRIGDH